MNARLYLTWDLETSRCGPGAFLGRLSMPRQKLRHLKECAFYALKRSSRILKRRIHGRSPSANPAQSRAQRPEAARSLRPRLQGPDRGRAGGADHGLRRHACGADRRAAGRGFRLLGSGRAYINAYFILLLGWWRVLAVSSAAALLPRHHPGRTGGGGPARRRIPAPDLPGSRPFSTRPGAERSSRGSPPTPPRSRRPSGSASRSRCATSSCSWAR